MHNREKQGQVMSFESINGSGGQDDGKKTRQGEDSGRNKKTQSE
jgi:hypothetical protein